jgi:transcriptional regulator with XRE-family HTH domain
MEVDHDRHPYTPRVPARPKQIVVSYRDIGARIKLLRQEQALSQAELCRRLGMSQPNLSSIERGRRGLTVHQVVKVAQVLGVSTDQILRAEKAPSSERRPRKRLMRQLIRIEELPYREQRILLQIVESFVRGHEQKRRRTEERSKQDKIPA